jgi:PD-(D/E)XK endonuclease
MGFLRPKGRQFSKPVVRGSAVEAHVVAALVRSGYLPLRPVIDGGRYDLVIEDAEGQFWRIQVKTGRYKNGSNEFHTRSTHIQGGYRGQADYFAVYSPDLDKTYLIAVGEVREAWANLRVDAVGKFTAKSRVRWAQDYEL